MAQGTTTFPTTLDTARSNPSNMDSSEAALLALQAKVGADSSAVATSHDYLLTKISNGPVLRGSATYDAASLDDAAGVTSTITVTGAALGDHCIVSCSVDLQGITLTGYVSTADTVSFRLQNESGGTIDLASATYRAMVFQV